MQYSVEMDIALPRARVIELFDNQDNMFKWQKGLKSFTHREGTPGEAGAVSDLVYEMGKRRIEMVETITERSLPDRFTGTYEAKGVWNLIENTFSENEDGTTHWRVDTEFKCTGVMVWLMAKFAPSMFRRETTKFMQYFKEFAESEG